MKVWPPYIMGVLLLAVAAHGQRKELALPNNYPYSPAFISTISAPPGHTELVVFPLRGKAFTIPIHSASRPFTYGPDGKVLYGVCTADSTRDNEPTQIGLCKIDLKTGSTTPVPGTMHPFRRIIPNREDSTFAHLFGFAFPDGRITITTITLQHPDQFPWTYLSLSPDGTRAVGTHNGRVDLIDVVRGTTEPFDDRFHIAAWSPDGKWLAAVEKGEKGRTILMDATDLKPRRTLGPSELDWSPDSHYLLGVKDCDPYYGTLEAINIETGERTTIKSSKCQINQATAGWVSNDIARE